MSRGDPHQVAQPMLSRPVCFPLPNGFRPCSSANALVRTSPRAHSFPTVFDLAFKTPGTQVDNLQDHHS